MKFPGKTSVRTTLNKSKILLTKLSFKQRLVFGSLILLLLGGVSIGVAMGGENQPQAVQIQKVATTKQAPAKKVESATTAQPSPTPDTPAPTPAPTSSAAIQPTQTPLPPRHMPHYIPGQVPPKPQPPVFTIDPLSLTSSRFARQIGTVNVTANTALNWSFIYNPGNTYVTGQPSGLSSSFTLNITCTQPQEGDYAIAVVGTDPATNLVTKQSIIVHLTNDPVQPQP